MVERVSGMPFAQYVERAIFAPLGMTHSTFAQPLPPALTPFASGAYLTSSEPARPFELVQPGPAGALSSTAEDMARFMIAHLQDGRLGDARILEPETARAMHARQFGLVADMNGMALGFYEESRNGMLLVLLGFVQVVFLLSVVLWPIAALVRRHYGSALELTPPEQRLRLAVRLASVAVVAVLVGWSLYFGRGMQDLVPFGTAWKGRAHALQVATALSGLASLLAVARAWSCWRRPGAWLGTRLAESVVGLASVAFVWLVLRYQLPSFGPTF